MIAETTLQIDLKHVLQEALSIPFPNLVTRPTGRAVRGSIEERLGEPGNTKPAVIDFGAVGCMDYSCADEIVAKLLLAHGHNRFFLLRGLTAEHIDALETVLERHGLAVAAVDRNGTVRLVGPVDDAARRAFLYLMERGNAAEEELVEHLQTTLDSAQAVLNDLHTRGLVLRVGTGYRALTAV